MQLTGDVVALQQLQARYADVVSCRWWIAERHYRSLARTGPDGLVLGLPDDLAPIGS